MFGIEDQQDFREVQKTVKYSDSMLKGHTKSHTLRPKVEAIIWKKPGSDLPADLRDASWEARGNWDSPWEKGLAAAIWGASFYHKDTGAGKQHFQIFLYLNSAKAQTNPPVGLSGNSPGSTETHSQTLGSSSAHPIVQDSQGLPNS